MDNGKRALNSGDVAVLQELKAFLLEMNASETLINEFMRSHEEYLEFISQKRIPSEKFRRKQLKNILSLMAPITKAELVYVIALIDCSIHYKHYNKEQLKIALRLQNQARNFIEHITDVDLYFSLMEVVEEFEKYVAR